MMRMFGGKKRCQKSIALGALVALGSGCVAAEVAPDPSGVDQQEKGYSIVLPAVHRAIEGYSLFLACDVYDHCYEQNIKNGPFAAFSHRNVAKYTPEVAKQFFGAVASQATTWVPLLNDMRTDLNAADVPDELPEDIKDWLEGLIGDGDVEGFLNKLRGKLAGLSGIEKQNVCGAIAILQGFLADEKDKLANCDFDRNPWWKPEGLVGDAIDGLFSTIWELMAGRPNPRPESVLYATKMVNRIQKAGRATKFACTTVVDLAQGLSELYADMCTK